MLKLPKMCRNEQGNVTMITLFIMLGVILAVVIISYYYGVFIVRRQTQNTVDAAAIAAAQELRYHYEDEMKKEVQKQLDDLFDSISLDDLLCSEGVAHEEETEEVPSCLTMEERLENKLGTANELVNKLQSGTFQLDEDWDLVVVHSFFSPYFTEFKNGDILYQTSLINSSKIRQASATVISKNKGDPSDFTITFPYEGRPEIFVNGSKVLIMQDVVEGSLDVPARGVAGIVTEFEINVANKVPITFH